VRRGSAYLVVAAAAALPRLVVLFAERGDILTRFTEKSDDFAQTFVASGTFGFVPGQPSAYTQPLYAFFLVPLYWVFGRHWLVVGVAQTVVAVATALVVYAIGRRLGGARVAVVGGGPGGLAGDLGRRLHLSAARFVSSWGSAAAVVACLAAVAWLGTRRPRFPAGDALLVAIAVSLLVNDTPTDVAEYGALTCAIVWTWHRVAVRAARRA
jgi:4-amino-4-deoxy-L-arabinose transferase-like glycosyltransferase